MSFGKPVNSRTLADVNRANADFHAPVKDAEAEHVTVTRGTVLAGRGTVKREGTGGPAPKNYQSSNYKKQSKEFKKRHGNIATDISHENGKQVIKQKGQVVAQHDEQDAMNPEARNSTASGKSHKGQRILGNKQFNMRAAQANKKNKAKAKDDRDSFPATDKTIADVNAANARFHNADSEDAEYKSNFNSPNERPPYLEEIPAKKKVPAKPAKDWNEGEWHQDPAQHAATVKHAVAGLRSSEIVRTHKGGEEIRQPGSYEHGDYSAKRYAPKSSSFHGDAFAATDKTIADVNDANLAYYNNSPHAGNAQDEEDSTFEQRVSRKNASSKKFPNSTGEHARKLGQRYRRKTGKSPLEGLKNSPTRRFNNNF